MDFNPHIKIRGFRIERTSYVKLYKDNHRKLQYLEKKTVLNGKDTKDLKECQKNEKFYTSAIHTLERLIDAVLIKYPYVRIAGYKVKNPDLTAPEKPVLMEV